MEETGDYFIRIVPFPVSCGGMVMPNDDGTYSIYLNANVDDCRRRRALIHELEHIKHGDLSNDVPIESCERL